VLVACIVGAASKEVGAPSWSSLIWSYARVKEGDLLTVMHENKKRAVME
jgi:hypothetical protein